MLNEHYGMPSGIRHVLFAFACAALSLSLAFGQMNADDKRDEKMFPMTLTEPQLAVVAYAKPLAEQLAGAQIAKTDENITQECYPPEKKKDRPLGLQLAAFKSVVTSERVESRLAIRTLRPATLTELLAFAATIDDSQLSSPIAALNGKCNIPGTTIQYIPVLSLSKKGKRELKLVRLGAVWSKDTRFLAAPVL